MLIPIGSYLLQRQSLKDERESLLREFKRKVDATEQSFEEKQKSIISECDEKIKKMIEDATKKMAPMWNFLGASFDHRMASSKCFASGEFGGQPSALEIINFVISFDICLDCLVRAGLCYRVTEIVYKYRGLIDTSRQKYPDVWNKAQNHFRNNVKRSNEFVPGSEYSDLLNPSSDIYCWLKDFFSQFIPWKFEN